MSVYLDGTSVLLNAGQVATDVACCCGATATGACCHDTSCDIETQADCEGSGGTYQGDGTSCVPNPCVTTGACCVGTDCSIQTESDCIGMGGTYQGDNIPCDPNPCCSCGTCPFQAFDGSSAYYLTKTYVFTRTASSEGLPCTEEDNFMTVKTITVNSDCTCDMNTTCSGNAHVIIAGVGNTCDWHNSGVHEHDDDAGFAGGCTELCEGCSSNTCSVCTLTSTTATHAECECHFNASGVVVDLTITADLSDPYICQ